MAAGTGRMYVIGDRDTGVLFVKTAPLRAAIIPRARIQDYADQHGIPFERAFALVARSAKGMIIAADDDNIPADVPEVHDTFFDLVNEGTIISDAEFCFIAEVQNEGWSERRYGYPPIEPALQVIGPEVGAPIGDTLQEVPLRDHT